jgi:RNA polymerase sigma factor (TIGR02999 family)
MPASSTDLPPITQLLQQATRGDRRALDQIYEALYPELKRLAHARLRNQGHGNALHTTTLVHESFLRLLGARELRLQDRRHFFAFAAKTMRHIIIDSAREIYTDKRGGGAEHVTLGEEAQQVADTQDSDELLRTHEALLALEAMDPDLAEVVEMRYFGGYSEREIAELLALSERTVRRRWDKARAWLFIALKPD